MADIFDVIADSTRRDILLHLLRRSSEGRDGTSVSEIVGELSVSQPTVSKHLKVLREAGLVAVREEGQHRFYTLSPEPLEQIDDWVMQFFVEEGALAEVAAAHIEAHLPDSASRVAESLGRRAASAKSAVQSALRRFGG
ncbi:MAG: metalloregulator ArsR/SmtB family transcription factor [Microbacterium sp.]